MRLKIFMITVCFTVAAASAGAQEHAMLTNVLRRHVDESGMVDYRGLCREDEFSRYISQLAQSDPDQLKTEDEQKAFWLNVYNAYTLKVICDNYPVKSISELHSGGLVLGTVLRSTVWHKPLVTVNGEKTSLDYVEHKILRPRFQDPRIHFAIVCAAKSCPPLRAEAYEASRLDDQLDDQGRKFLAQEDKNFFDPEERVARISPIFFWFKKDFGRSNTDLLLFLARYLPDDVAAVVRAGPARWRIRSTPYDWSLNEQ